MLTEGETEEGALPIWFQKQFGDTLADNDWAIFDVGGDHHFGPYIAYLRQFDVRWAIVCDGAAIGDRGARCSIGGQLRQAGIKDLDILTESDFATRRAQLEEFGVFTISTSTRQDFNMLEVIEEHREEAVLAVGKTKPRVGRYIAMNYPCPAEVATLLGKVRQHLERDS